MMLNFLILVRMSSMLGNLYLSFVNLCLFLCNFSRNLITMLFLNFYLLYFFSLSFICLMGNFSSNFMYIMIMLMSLLIMVLLVYLNLIVMNFFVFTLLFLLLFMMLMNIFLNKMMLLISHTTYMILVMVLMWMMLGMKMERSLHPVKLLHCIHRIGKMGLFKCSSPRTS